MEFSASQIRVQATPNMSDAGMPSQVQREMPVAGLPVRTALS
jgi:hypothetical protein